MLNGRKIILDITGSIAAYKACCIIRSLTKQEAKIQIVIAPAGREFITPVTLFALTSKPVISEFLAQRSGTWNSHVDLGLWAGAMLIAPATASAIGKMANNTADNMLITAYLSAKAPMFIASAMGLDIFTYLSTQRDLDTLRSYGNHIIEPTSGELASHLVGKGCMGEPENTTRVLDGFPSSTGELAGKKVLAIAGPTYEKIGPVRLIGNYSSGKMGFALAEECVRRGAEVVLIVGPVQQKVYHSYAACVDMESAQEMCKATITQYTLMDIEILCTAVVDFTPGVVADKKTKREGDDLMLHLKPTHDTAAASGKLKMPGQRLIGFALGMSDEQRSTGEKPVRKNFDFTVLNPLNDAGVGFRYDANRVSILSRRGRTDYPLKSKTEMARDVIDRMIEEL